MIGRTLFLYIAWRFTKAVAGMFLLLLFLTITVEFIENMRRLSEQADISTGFVLVMSSMKAPYYIDKAFPFTGLFAAMFTLIQLNNKMELVVARAAGVSAWQFLMPIGTAAVAIGLFAATCYNPLSLALHARSLDMQASVQGMDNDNAPRKASEFWLRQRDDAGSTVIKANIARNGGTLLNGVTLVRFDAGDALIERIDAEVAIHGGQQWLLLKGKRAKAGEKAEDFDSAEIPTNVSGDYLLGVSSRPDSVSFWSLSQAAAKIAASGLNQLPYLVQFQSLLALPLFMVAMVVIAATASLRFVRFGQAGKLIMGGILAGFVLYALSRLVTSLGSNGIVPPFVAAWSPAFVAILFGMTILLYQEDG